MTIQYDAGYNIGVEEIFFNIWRKCQDVDYRFLGGELNNLMERWIDEEKKAILDPRPPPSPQYPEVEKGDEVMEVTLPTKVPEQAPPVDDEEEEITSNPPPAEDEIAPIALNEAALVVPDKVVSINLEEDEPTANATNDFPSA